MNLGGRPPRFTDKELDELADSLHSWVDQAVFDKKNFLLGDWCFENDINPCNIKRYVVRNENFKEAYELAKAWQAHMIAKGALYGKLNAKFAQFFLGCNHNWKTQEVIEHKGNEQISVVYYGTNEPKKWPQVEGPKLEGPSTAFQGDADDEN